MDNSNCFPSAKEYFSGETFLDKSIFFYDLELGLYLPLFKKEFSICSKFF